MVRLRTSFANYVTVWVVGLHLVLLPALFFGMGYVIRKSHEDLFVEHARTFARVLAEEFEAGVALDSQERTSDLLDLAVIHGEARYAELFDGSRAIASFTGCARALLTVKHPAATHGRSLKTSARSFRTALMPQFIPAYENPIGVFTVPSAAGARARAIRRARRAS